MLEPHSCCVHLALSRGWNERRRGCSRHTRSSARTGPNAPPAGLKRIPAGHLGAVAVCCADAGLAARKLSTWAQGLPMPRGLLSDPCH
eukprot:205844-Prymnesium_polylepis.1